MENKYLNKLEFNKIVENLASFSITDNGKDACFRLMPSYSKTEVEMLLQETTEANILLLRKNEPPLCPICNIDVYLKVLESEGILSIKALLELGSILKISRKLKEYIRF